VMAGLSGPAGPAAVVATGRHGIDPAMDGLSEPLRAALMQLDEGFRFAVVLCDLLGFPYVEAADILGVQEGTIKSRIFRAREALATSLVAAGYESRGASAQTARNQDDGSAVPRTGLIGKE
jgi:DNA-directed RNA polymerase specialized sigma24 family protein